MSSFLVILQASLVPHFIYTLQILMCDTEIVKKANKSLPL